MYVHNHRLILTSASGDTTVYRYYVRDYLGSTRAVLAEDGTLLQDANYYPGGLSFSQLNDNEETDRLHCGKEWVDMEGLGWYDNTARFHDAILCRFTTPDPLAEQYPDLSPYSHCANNPLTIVDPSGRDIVVLVNPEGAFGLGHMAMLVQDKNGKWQLWSKNGTEDSFGFKVKQKSPGGEHDDKGVYIDGGPIEFINSSNNIYDGEYIYNEGYLIETTASEDAQAIDTAREEMEVPYNVTTSNCAALVQKALKAAGKQDGTMSIEQRVFIPFMDMSDELIIEKSPSIIYERIVEQNEGTRIKPIEENNN